MESINYKAVGKALLNLITSNYEEEDREPEEVHFAVAEYLMETLENVESDFLFVEENENTQVSEVSCSWNSQSKKRKKPAVNKTLSLDYKKEVLEYIQQNPLHSFATIQHKYRHLRHRNYVDKWKSHVEQGGTRQDILSAIDEDVYGRFKESRDELSIVHDEDLQKFGLIASQKHPNFNFKASMTWVYQWKKKYSITSRKVQKLKKRNTDRLQEEIQFCIDTFRQAILEDIQIYEAANIWNTDQVGFQYEIVSGRTLSFKGERRTVGSAFSPKNRVTHSYTVQYIISLAGKIIGDVFVVLQEQSGRIGERVQQNMVHAPNVTVSSSKSGKLTSSHVEYFLDNVVSPHAEGKVLYLLDHWRGQTDSSMYTKRFNNDKVDMTLRLIPEQTTDVLQPLDTYFNRQLKLLVRKMYGHCKLFNEDDYNFMSTRNGILMVQSLAHFVLSSPRFEGMIQHSWYKAGLKEDPVEFSNVKQVCFQFEDKICQENLCENVAFIQCPWCCSVLCHVDFYRNYHMMGCLKGPYGHQT